MDMIVVAVVATMALGAPQGILLGLATAVIAAAVRARGTLRERALGMLKTGPLQASAAFSLAALALDDWSTVAIVWFIAAFLLAAWRGPATATGRDRWGLVARFAAALAGFALARLLVDWVATPTAAWLLAVALLASGVFRATLCWSALPWFAGVSSRARSLGLVANLALCALIIAVAFV